MELTVPDCRAIDAAAARARPTVAPRAGDLFCVIDPAIWRAMLAHAASVKGREVGGVLLGEVCVDGAGPPYLFIDGHVPALAAASATASVTFTADAWTAIHDYIDRERPGASIVGWYHTHPNFGIFLSEMDLFIQRHFFNAPHQVAIVIDPVRGESGAFVWHKGEATREPVHVDEMGHVEEVAPIVPASHPSDIIRPRSIAIAAAIAAAVVVAAVILGRR